MPFSVGHGSNCKIMKIKDLLTRAKSGEKLETGNETAGRSSQSFIETLSLMYPES
jgi:hypothetical protein